MIAALVGVAERGALLVAAVDLTDKRIDVDDQSLIARAGARRPRPRQAPGEHAIELADMPERERAQERAQRRGRRDPMTQHRRVWPERSTSQSSMQSAPSAIAEHIVITLRPGFAAPGRITEIHALLHERLDPQPPRQQRRQHHARVGDHPLIVKDDDRRVVHHEGDLLSRAATAAICRF